MRVYADNAATTKLSPAAKEAMLPYFDEIYGNPSTLYTLGQEAAEHLLACRTEIAQLIGAADPREIVFTSGGSEADNQAIISAARNGARKGKKHLISTKFEPVSYTHLDVYKRQADIAGGRAAGMHTCWFDPADRGAAMPPQADWRITRLEELLAIL